MALSGSAVLAAAKDELHAWSQATTSFRANLRRGRGQHRQPVGGQLPRCAGQAGRAGDREVGPCDPAPKLDVLFASLPTEAPRPRPLAAHVPKNVKIDVDIGGDHRHTSRVGRTALATTSWPAQIEGQIRVANPGCFPAAALSALAPLLVDKLIEPGNIVIDAKTGISGAGRGGADSKFGYAESNENLVPYGLLKHVHMPEMAETIERLSGGSAAGLVFTPHLVPMTRGVLATMYCRGRATTGQCLDAARRFYAERAFVRVTDKPPQAKWATGSNLAFVSYAADPERNLVIAMGVVDNLGKGAAGQAVQNANLICGLPETAGLDGVLFGREEHLRVRVVRRLLVRS